MAKVKVRCTGCGAMNRDELADRCRVCGTILADAAHRRAAKLGAVSSGPAFSVLVESEVAAWEQYAEKRNEPNAKSRRPPELDAPKTSKLPWRRKSASTTQGDEHADPAGEVGA